MDHNNVLVLGAPGTGKIRLAQFITKDYDTSTLTDKTHSGLVYNGVLLTKYFTLKINLLIEEFPHDRTDPTLHPSKCLKDWYQEFLTDEMADLRDVIEGVVFTFNMDDYEAELLDEQLRLMGELKDLLEENDAFFVVMGISTAEIDQNVLEDIEDQVIMNGFEFVNYNESGTNEFNEKTGRDRLREVFETHEWSQRKDPSLTEEQYMEHKQEKMLLMTESLLPNEESEELPLDVLLKKLQLEKSKVAEMDENDRKAYVDSLVEEYLEYF